MVNIRHSYGLRTHPCGGAPHPGYVVFHTQTALLGWGTTSVVLSMPDDMPPLGWGITLVDGGQSRQRDKQYAPILPFYTEEACESNRDGPGVQYPQLDKFVF